MGNILHFVVLAIVILILISNTSNAFLTLGKPDEPKHAFSTLSSKHDSMCHRKVCIGQKMITQNPESS